MGKDRLKVAHATNCYSRQNGVVVAINQIHKGLQELGIESLILAPDKPCSINGPDDSVIIVDGIMGGRDCGGYSRYAKFTPELRKQLKDVDVFHIHHVSIAFPFIGNPLTRVAFDYALHEKKKVVFHNHTRNDLYAPVYSTFCSLIPGIASRVARKINVRNCNDADCVIAPSQSIAALLQEWGVKSRIEVVPTNIDFEKFSRGNREKVRRDYEIDDKILVVAYIGRLSQEKNVLSLAYLGEITNIKPMFVGDGPQRKKLEGKLEESSNSAIFMGAIPYLEIQDYYAASDVIVTASKSETQCLAIWEAHAAGKPVVALDAPGTRDYVTDGKDGFLSGTNYKSLPEDVSARIFFGSKIHTLDEDREWLRRLSEGARETAERRKGYCSAERLVKIYEGLL